MRVLLIVSRPVTTPGGAASDPDYEYREIGAEELARAASDPGLNLSLARVREVVTRGDLVFGVLHRGRLVAYRFYSLSGPTPCGDGQLIEYSCPNRAYGYRAFVHPDHRGRRLSSEAARQSDALLAQRGCAHTIGYIDATNTASLHAYARAPGAQRIGFIVSMRLGERLLVFRSPGAARSQVNLVTA